MLEKLSDYFYDPVVFWTVPLVLVALAVGWRRVRAWAKMTSFPHRPDKGG